MTTDSDDESARSAEAVILDSELDEASTGVVHSWSRHTSIVLTEVCVLAILGLGMLFAEELALLPIAGLASFALLLEFLRRRARLDLRRIQEIEADLSAALDSERS